MSSALDEVIAKRNLEFRTPDGVIVPVSIRIGKPQADPNPGGAWRCSVQIEGFHDSLGTRWVSGEDSYQALLLAIEIVFVDVEGEVRRANLILTSGEKELGLLPRRL